MSSFALRMLALLSMVIDHAGLALFPDIGAFRCVGRLAFPLYCFLLTQGFIHTRDLSAYARRLLLFALLSEIPFDLLIFGTPVYGLEQNVLFSLLCALGALYCVRTLRRQPYHAAVCVLLMSMAAMIARVSFGWLSIALCVCFYCFREKKASLLISAAAVLMLYTLSLLLSGVAQSWVLVSLCALLALPLLLMYSGRSGPRKPLLTVLFYVAYPIHLLVLIAIRALRIVPPYFF